MTRLLTPRLELVACSAEHAAAELAEPNGLGTLLGVPLPDEWPPDEYDRAAVEFFHAQLAAGGDAAAGWYTWYAMRRGAEGGREALVGTAGYVGPPRDGRVEIGYSVLAAEQRRGYATEIVQALVARAFALPEVACVFAHTVDANVASIKVLEKSGFIRAGASTDPGTVRYERFRASLVIRRLAPHDTALFDAMLTLFGAAFDNVATYGAKRPSPAYRERLLGRESFIALVACRGDDVVGALAAYELVKFEQERSEIYLYDLAVAEAQRRRGVATALIGELKRIARDRGAYVVFVQADHGDDPAIALYTKLGVREDVLHFDIPVDDADSSDGA